MSVVTSKDVFCDECEVEWIHGGTQCTDKHARFVAGIKGWKRRVINGVMKDLCPTCDEKFRVKGREQ